MDTAPATTAVSAGSAPAADDPSAQVPPLLRVERFLRIGRDWRVETHIRRLSPAEFPVAVEVPLLPGEAVTAPCLALTAPISFWGGVDPRSGALLGTIEFPPAAGR